MTKAKLTGLALAALVAVGLMAAPAQAEEAAPQTNLQYTTLPNGLILAVVPDHRAERVAINLCFTVGAFDEPDGKTGLAHAFEHSWFNGSENVEEGEYDRFINLRGGNSNAFTMQDRTCYVANTATRYLDELMWLYAETWQNLNISAERFERERNAILEERRMRTDNDATARFMETFNHFHYPNYPYGRPIIGWPRDINAWTVDDLNNWFATNYVPNNAVMVLAGDVTLDEAEDIVSRHFGDLERGNPPFVNNNATVPLWDAPKVMDPVYDPQAGQAMFIRKYRAPGTFTGLAGADGDRETAVALSLASSLLGGDATSYLSRKLVHEDGRALWIGAAYSPNSRGESSFILYAYPTPGTDMKTLEAAIDSALAEWLTGAYTTADDLELARRSKETSVVFAQDSVSGLGRYVGNWVSAGGDPATLDGWLTIQQSLSTDDVLEAAREVLDINQSTTGYLLPGTPPQN